MVIMHLTIMFDHRIMLSVKKSHTNLFELYSNLLYSEIRTADPITAHHYACFIQLDWMKKRIKTLIKSIKLSNA